MGTSCQENAEHSAGTIGLTERMAGLIRCLAIAFLTAAGCFLASLFSSGLYLDPDNYYIAQVVCGLYDDVGQCQFLHPLLSRLLCRLSVLLPAADTFMLFIHVCAFLEIFCLTAFLLWKRKSLLLTGAVALLFLLASFDLAFFNCNFTVVTASFAATGLLFLSYAQRHDGARSELTAGICFFTLAFLCRMWGAMLAVPYLALDTAANVFCAADRRGMLKRCALVLLPCLLLVGILALTDAGMNADAEHRYAKEYNQNRFLVTDYLTRPWDEVSDKAGDEVPQVYYEAARRWLLFDTERIDAQMLGKISALGTRTAYRFIPREILEAVAFAFLTMIRLRPARILSGLLGLLSVMGWIILPNPRRLEILLCDLGTFLIILVFTMIGRIPARFWETVLLFPLGLVFFLLASDPRAAGKRESRTLVCLLLLCALYGLGKTLPNLEYGSAQLASRARTDLDESAFSPLLGDGEVYLWDEWERVGLPILRSRGKLPTRELLKHVVTAGNWYYGQPYFNSYLRRLGSPNPADALLKQDNVYLITRDLHALIMLLEERTAGTVEAEQIGMFMDCPIYKITEKS